MKDRYSIPISAFTSKSSSLNQAITFSKGCNGSMSHVKNIKSNKSIATYGILRGAGELIKRSAEFWYIDHGYFGDSYFRIIRNNILHSGVGDFDDLRLSKFNLSFKKWKKDGKYILICPPSKSMSDFLELNDWLTDVITKVRKYTDREIVISRKSSPSTNNPQLYSPLEKNLKQVSIQEGLNNAWCLITDHSNTMISALIEGVPIICTNINRKIGNICDIESPIYNRDLLHGLAYNQWTLNEIKSGRAWRELNEWG